MAHSMAFGRFSMTVGGVFAPVHARRDLADDLVGIFGAGIIRGDNGHIGESGGNTAHDGALKGVAVAAAAKDGDDVPAAEAAHGLQNVLEADRRV